MGASVGGMRRQRHLGEGRKHFFFEKEKQKTFDFFGTQCCSGDD
jgi:hypothetical protein